MQEKISEHIKIKLKKLEAELQQELKKYPKNWDNITINMAIEEYIKNNLKRILFFE